MIINQAMLIERDRHLKAERYERTPERVSYANGFKPKQLKTRCIFRDKWISDSERCGSLGFNQRLI